MRVIIAGSRTLKGKFAESLLYSVVNMAPFDITEVVSGGAQGIDYYGEQWALANCVPFLRFPADWNKYKKAAGPIRNKQMADYADALIYVKTEHSVGTEHMIQEMTKQQKPSWGVVIASKSFQDTVC